MRFFFHRIPGSVPGLALLAALSPALAQAQEKPAAAAPSDPIIHDLPAKPAEAAEAAGVPLNGEAFDASRALSSSFYTAPAGPGPGPVRHAAGPKLLAQNTAPSPSPAGEGSAPPAGPEDAEVPGPSNAEALAGLDLPTPPPPPAVEGGESGDGDLASTPTGNVVVNLIQLLVQRGVLTQGDASALVVQAQHEAETVQRNSAAAEVLAADAALAREGDVVVTHIPEPVRARLREELKQEVLLTAREERWAAPGLFPDWADRVSFFGDFRLRYEGTMFPEGNDTTGSFPDFNRINTGDPFDVAGYDFSPQLNVDEERHRYRLRARFGAEIQLEDGFSTGFRLATGNDDSPVSTNQTLGGEFNKYAIWLDKAYLRWERKGDLGGAAFQAGRFENPFFEAEDVLWDPDLGFDGFSVQARRELWRGFTPFFNGGVFPLYNTDFHFATNQPDKFESIDKWLYGAQAGVDLKPGRDVGGKFALAYYDFDNVEGEVSDPFIPFSSKDQGNTDITRPSFAQKGNTYMPLRSIIPDPLNNFGTTNQYQYFGLASKYQVLHYNARVDLDFFEPVRVTLLGEYATNVGYQPEVVRFSAVNNRGPVPVPADGAAVDPGAVGEWAGGTEAWNLGIQFGHAAYRKRGDWQASIGYRYIESDAFVDAFTSSDFGLGGTNVEGYTVKFGVALSPSVNVGLRWMGANEIAGPPLKSDILFIDLNASF